LRLRVASFLPNSVHILARAFATNKTEARAGFLESLEKHKKNNRLLILSLLIRGVTVVCEPARLYTSSTLPTEWSFGSDRFWGRFVPAEKSMMSEYVPASRTVLAT
jgi:hypothetical protein